MSDSKVVGAYPEAENEPGFASFVAAAAPRLRAGALNPYRVNLPAMSAVSNAVRELPASMRRGDDGGTVPGARGGSLQLIIIPTTKLLIAKQDPTIEDVGDINGILDAISPAITGSVAVEAEEVASAKTVSIDGKSYYRYELVTPFAESGLHNVAVVSTNKNYVMIATIGASEKQYAKSEGDLKKILDSFRC